MTPFVTLSTSNPAFVGVKRLAVSNHWASLRLVVDLGKLLDFFSQPKPTTFLSSDVGTGLLLGGGLSYLSARHGFSVDALVAADVVLVDGRVVTANATNEYSDLFRALKVLGALLS